MRKLFFTYLLLVANILLAQIPFQDSTAIAADTTSVLGFDSSIKVADKSKTFQAAPKLDSAVEQAKDTSKSNEDTAKSSVTQQALDSLSAEIKEVSDSLNEEKKDTPSLKDLLSWGKVIWSLIIILIAHFVIKVVIIIIERFAERSVKHRMTLKSIAPVVRILSWVIVLIIVIQGVFQPPIQTIFAVTASVGIAIGFAAQDILKNIFGGIMILFDRPFQVGDKIEVGEHYGEVKEIGLRSTRIVTKDDSLVSIPNAEVVNKAVSNSNAGEANCQVVAEVYLPIDVDTNKARQLAIEAAQVSQYIYLNKPIAVVFINEVKEHRSYLKMRLKAYVSDIRYEFAFQSDMTEIVIREFMQEGLITKKDLS